MAGHDERVARHGAATDPGEAAVHGPARKPGKRTLTQQLDGASRDPVARLEAMIATARADRGALAAALGTLDFAGALTAARYLQAVLDSAREQLAAVPRDHRAELAAELDEIRTAAAPLLARAPAADGDLAGAERRWRAANRAPDPGLAAHAQTVQASLGVSGVAIHSDDAARARTEAAGARGLAELGAVWLHPDHADAEVVAHELVHHAQAGLPAAQDEGRDAAESEARELAQAYAAGGSIGRPRRAIDLREPAADKGGKKPKGGGHLGGKDFAVEGSAADPHIFISAKWLQRHGVRRGFLGEINGKQHPALIKALLGAVLPMFPYAKQRGEDPLTHLATINFETDETLWQDGEQELGVGRTLFLHLGLPPAKPVQVFPTSDGLEIYADTAYSYPKDKNPAGVKAARDALIESALDELDVKVGAKLDPAKRARLRADFVKAWTSQHASVLYATMDTKALTEYFGAKAATAYANKEPGTGNAVIELGGMGNLLIRAKDEAERQKVVALLEEIYGKAKPAADGAEGELVTPDDIAALLALDQDKDHRAELIALLQEGAQDPKTKRAWNSPYLRDVIANARVRLEERAANQALGRKDDRKPGGDKGILPYPVPGNIVNLSGEINLGMRAEFEFKTTGTADPREGTFADPFFFHVPEVWIEWYSIEVDEAGKPIGTPEGHERVRYIEPREDGWLNDKRFEHKFKKTGQFQVHAFVEHSMFQPAHFQITVEVITEADRLTRMEGLQAERWGTETKRDAKVFRGVDDNRQYPVSTNEANEQKLDKFAHKYAKGSRAEGLLDEDVAAAPRGGAVDEIDRLDREIAALDDLEAQYPGDDRRSKAMRDYAQDRREKLESSRDRVDKSLDDADANHVQIQGNFASRTHGVSSGVLNLVSFFKLANKTFKGTLLDHSEIVSSEHYRFTQDAPGFEAMMEKLFDDLTKSYPDGSISLAFQLYEQLTATNKFVRFTRKTDTVGKDFKEVAYDDKTRIAVTLVSLILSLFPPTAPLGIALGLIYNGIDVIGNLSDAVRTDTVTSSKIVDVGMLALDILPALGAFSKTTKIGTRLYHVIEATQFLGSVYLLADGVHHGVLDLRDRLIKSLAEKHQALAQARQLNASSPEVAQLQQEIAGLESDIHAAAKKVFTEAVASQGLQMASHAVIRHLAGDLFAKKSGGGVDADDEPHTHQSGADDPSSGTRGSKVYERNKVDTLKEPALHAELGKLPGTRGGDVHFSASGGTGNLTVKTGDGTKHHVDVEFKIVPELDPARAHDGDAGPAEVKLTPPDKPGGRWKAEVTVASTVGKKDLSHVVGHELDEAAEIVRRHHADPTIDLAAEHEARVFKPGADPRATPTAHDVAAAKELAGLFEAAKQARDDYNAALARRNDPADGSSVPKSIYDKHARAVDRLQRKLEAMGFGPDVDPKSRLDLIEPHTKDPKALRDFVDQFTRDPAGQRPDATASVKSKLHPPQVEKLAGLGVDEATAQRLADKGVNGPALIDVAQHGGLAGVTLLDTILTNPSHATACIAIATEAGKRGKIPQVQAAAPSVSRFAASPTPVHQMLDLLDGSPASHFEAMSWMVGNPNSQRRIPIDIAQKVLKLAAAKGVEGKVVDLINSGKLRNPSSLSKFLAELGPGDAFAIDLAVEQAKTKDPSKAKDVTLEGAEGDVVVHGKRDTVIQAKQLTSKDTSAFADHTYKAVKQLRGDTGEIPSPGSERVAAIDLPKGHDLYDAVQKGRKAEVVKGLHDRSPPDYAGMKSVTTPPGDGTVGWEKIEVRAGSKRVVIQPKDL